MRNYATYNNIFLPSDFVGFQHKPTGLVGIVKPVPGVSDDIEGILDDILGVGVSQLPYWLFLLFLAFYSGYQLKKLWAVDIDIHFRSVSIIDNGRMLIGWCIYDVNDTSAYWLGLLYQGSDVYSININLDGTPTTCLVFRNSFNNNPMSELYETRLYNFGMSAKLCVPHPNNNIWILMLWSGCTIKTNGHPLLPDIRRFNGQTVPVVWIHGSRPDLSWTVSI